MHTATRPLGRGERAPDFVLSCQDGTPTRFYAKAGGRPAVLLFYDAEDMDELRRFAAALTDGADRAVSLFAVQRDTPAMTQQVFTGRARRFLVFTDPQGTVRTAYRPGATDTTTLFVLDPNLRVLASLVLQDARATAHQVLALLDASLPQIAPLEITTQAPVLLIPYALDQELCQSLIHVWETQGNVATGVEQSRGDRREATLSPDSKRRRDHTVRDAQLVRHLSSTIGRRVMPEVSKAFAFRATRFEGFKIACYDAATGGFFPRPPRQPEPCHRAPPFCPEPEPERGLRGRVPAVSGVRAPPLPPGGRRRPRVRLLAPARSDGGDAGTALRAALVSLWRGGCPPRPSPVKGQRSPAPAVIPGTVDLAAGGHAGRGA
jgi:peroxiredoxin